MSLKRPAAGGESCKQDSISKVLTTDILCGTMYIRRNSI